MSQIELKKLPDPVGEPVAGPPAGWTVIGGEPLARSWRSYTSSDGRKLAGFWRCSKGKFRVAYEKWEFCHMVEGRCVITRDGGNPVDLKAGDSFVLEAGFSGTWEIIEAMAKHFVFVGNA
jgi:uncharacterized protein